MLNISKILCPIDFSDNSREAIKHAIKLSKAFDAKLCILHVLVLFAEDPQRVMKGIPEIEDLIRYYEDEAEKNLEDFRALSKMHAVDYSVVTVRGMSAAEEILRYDRDNNIDLIVMGTNGRGMIEHLLLGSVAEKVIRYAQSPVFTVKKAVKKIKVTNGYKKILAPFDFSEISKSGLASAVSLAKKYNSFLTVMHVFQTFPPHLISQFNVENSLRFNLEIEDKIKDAIIEAVKEIDSKFKKYTPVVAEGHPAKVITDYSADNDTDLIVMSDRGLNSVDSLLLGSTTARVVRHVKIPVLAVRNGRDFHDRNKSMLSQIN